MKKTVRNVEKAQETTAGGLAARKEYGKPQLTVYEDLKAVTGQPTPTFS
jgi:hypothetical protein